MTNDEKLYQYYQMLFPEKLKEDEYIRLVCMKKNEPDIVELDGTILEVEKKDSNIVHLVKSYDDYSEIVRKYKYNFNIYNNISTVKSNGDVYESGTKEHMRQRRVLFLDFDKKDYPTLKTSEEFVQLVKERCNYNLFIQCMVDTGNGFHMYISIKPSCDKNKVSELNKRLIHITGADSKAGSPTQIARVPTSRNLKDKDNWKSVNIIFNEFGNLKCNPYTLQRIEQIISFTERSIAVQEKKIQELPELQKQIFFSDKPKRFYCIDKMLYEGADKGERNFCLGRIINYNKLQGTTEEKTKKLVLDWNTRCRPPKSETEVINEFHAYWKTDYKLLGCHFVDGTREHKILDYYCDRNLCSSVHEGEMKSVISGDNSVVLCNRMLEPKVMKDLSGNDYLILTILMRYKNQFSKRGVSLGKLKGLLSDTKSKRCCLSDATLKKILMNLEAKKYIKLTYSDKKKQFNEYLKVGVLAQRDFGAGYTPIYFSTVIMLLCSKLTPPEFRLYLHLVYSVYQGKSVTYDAIANELGIDKSNVSKYIKGLHKAKVLEITKTYNEKGYQVNRYGFFGDDRLCEEYSNGIKLLINRIV